MSFKTVSDSHLLGFSHPWVGMLTICKPLAPWLVHDKRFCASGAE